MYRIFLCDKYLIVGTLELPSCGSVCRLAMSGFVRQYMLWLLCPCLVVLFECVPVDAILRLFELLYFKLCVFDRSPQFLI